jgi:hypothetical protein
MKKKKKSSEEPIKPNGPENLKNPDDSLKPLSEMPDEEPEIFKISKRGKSIDRKEFLTSAAALGGLVALGSLLKGCDESELDIEKVGSSCTCHAVCSCDVVKPGYESQYDDNYDYYYDNYGVCTCDSVCTCNSVCSCNTVCTCDSEGGGGGGYYTYYYPN